MSVQGAITRFRRKQAEQFTATARVDRPIGLPAYDPDTQQSVQTVEVVGTFPCKLTNLETTGVAVETAQTTVREVGHLIKFPVGTDVTNRDIVTILTTTYGSDAGRQFTVDDVDRREWQISRRCTVTETVVPLSHEED